MALSVRYASDTQYIESRMDCREWLLDVLFFGWKSGGGGCVAKGLTVHVHENGRLQWRGPRMINCFARQPTVQILSAQGTNRNFVANNATIQRVDVRFGGHRQIITIPHYDWHRFSF